MITTRQLTKRFGAVLAVDEVDLDVREGDRYGLLGPNGSGKTTLIRMLLGLVFASSGRIEVAGVPVPAKVAQVLPQIGAMIEGPAAYGYLSGRANLGLIDAAGPGGPRRTRKARIDEALERVGLAGVDRRPVRAYSLGMRQRLGLAAALLRTPRLLVLDEPTNGLDPRGIREIRDLLAELNAAGATILLSSHLLGEVEQLCTRIGVLDRGRLVIQDELASLRRPTDRVELRTPDADRVVAMLDGRVDARDGDRLIIRHLDSAQLNAQLVGAGLRVTEIVRERRSLEDVVVGATRAGSDRIDARETKSGGTGRPVAPGRAAGHGPNGSSLSGGSPNGSGPEGSGVQGSGPKGSDDFIQDGAEQPGGRDGQPNPGEAGESAEPPAVTTETSATPSPPGAATATEPQPRPSTGQEPEA